MPWFAAALDASRLPPWTAAVAKPEVGMATARLEAGQRELITQYYGQTLRLADLYDGYEQFGADLLPLDDRRDDPHHRMNGETMWGYWFAFCDASIRLAGTTPSIPAAFWRSVARATLIGMMNDGVYRQRFTVNGFANVPQDHARMRTFVAGLADSMLPDEMLKRIRESGLIS
mgnify:CR=1 FL=1